METIKKPEMLLSMGNTAFTAGVAIYFYKQINAIKAEQTELSDHLKTSVKAFAEAQSEYVTRSEVHTLLNELNGKVSRLEKKLEGIGKGDDLELLEEALESLADALEDAGIEWEYPPRRKRRGGRRNKKRKPKKREYTSSSEESSSEESSESSESDVDRAIAKVRGKRSKSKRKN